MNMHHLEVVDNAAWVERSADVLALGINSAVDVRGACLMALSGGSTPGPVLENLAARDLPWDKVTIFQVDERIVPLASPDRNFSMLLHHLGHLPSRFIPLPIDLDPGEPMEPAIDAFVQEFVEIAGDPPVLDLVHLGLGDDGHTASLIPNDPVTDDTINTVGMSGEYEGTFRLTLTRPILDRARLTVWLVRGENKREPLAKLLAGDTSIPAGKLQPQQSIIVADHAAGDQLAGEGLSSAE